MEKNTFKLTVEQRQKLVDMEADLEFILTEIRRAERAGIDVNELQAKFDKMAKLRTGLLREYS